MIRFRGVIQVENADGEGSPPRSGSHRGARRCSAARGSRGRAAVPAVVVVHAPKMKEPWCLATTLASARRPRS